MRPARAHENHQKSLGIIDIIEKRKNCEIINLCDKKTYSQFSEAINERKKKGHITETTFIGINSAKIQKHEKKENFW